MLLNAVLRHSLAACAAAESHGLRATIGLPRFTLDLQGDGVRQQWHARFMTQFGGRPAYTQEPQHGTTGFAGWLPYGLRQWPEGCDKAAFRSAARERGLPTPPATTDPARLQGAFLVKNARGSFGLGQRGPFPAFDPADPAQRLQEGESYEAFVRGRMAKAWYWGARCVAVDVQSPPTVTGDGRSTLRALAQGAGGFAVHDLALLARLGALCGVGAIDDVVPARREVLVHYRYGADPRQADGNPYGVPPSPARPDIPGCFAAVAGHCASFITAAGHPPETLSTLDAVIDAAGTAWFLEMNCNPLVHPDAYAAMLDPAAAPGLQPAAPPAARPLQAAPA